MLRHVAVITTALLLSAPVTAQNTPAPKPAQPGTPTAKAPALSIGDKAPPLTIEKWVKGDPITGFEKGKVYVVEFWATWCGPCVASIPHLSEIQKEYKEKGVSVIGTNIWETYDAGTYDKVVSFVKEKNPEYTVAYDGTSKSMDKSYMQASGSNGIPTAFIINQDGKIAYIGHPMGMDQPLKEIVAGTYDLKAAAEKTRKAKESEKEARSFGTEYPKLLKSDPPKAYELARRTMDSFGKDNPQLLNQIAWLIVDPKGNVEKKDLDLALKAALRAEELTEHKDAAIIDTVARVYFCKGDTAKAIELQKKAVSLAQSAPAELKNELEANLKEYEAAKK